MIIVLWTLIFVILLHFKECILCAMVVPYFRYSNGGV